MKQGIPKSARDLLAKQALSEEHPSADLLNGYVEQSLTAGEKTVVMNHLALCGECREVVFLASGVAQEAASAASPHRRETAAAAKEPHRSNWIWRWKWAVPAVAVFVIAAGVLIERDRRQSRFDRTVPEVAAVEQQTQPSTPNEEEKSRDLAIQPSTVGKKAAAPAQRPASEYENETYVKDTRERDKLDAAARRQEPSQAQTQTRYWAMQQSQMAKSQAATSAAVAGGQVRSQPQPSPAAAATGGSRAQPPAATVPPASQTVEVTSAAPLVQADNADLSTNFAANTPNGGNDLTYNQKPAAALKSGMASSAESGSSLNKIAVAHNSVPPNAQWRITADGHLERGFAGSNWTRLLAEEPVSFRTVSVVGKQVWAGGSDGALFHSTDRGMSWDKVALSTDGQTERSAIISIRFDSALQGTVTTEAGTTWTTSDGGQSWSRR